MLYDEIERSIKVHVAIAMRWLQQLPDDAPIRNSVTEYIADIGQALAWLMAMRTTFDPTDPIELALLNHRAANALHAAQVVQRYDLLVPIVDRIIDDMAVYRRAHAIVETM